jgi:hypothetical protein
MDAVQLGCREKTLTNRMCPSNQLESTWQHRNVVPFLTVHMQSIGSQDFSSYFAVFYGESLVTNFQFGQYSQIRELTKDLIPQLCHRLKNKCLL